MTHVQPGTPSRNTSARIRILGCDAPPPPKRTVRWPLVAAGAAVAVLGVGITLAGQAFYPQKTPAPSEQRLPAASIELMGQASGGARLTNRHTYSVMAAALKADMYSAARYARSSLKPSVTRSGAAPADPVIAPVTTTVPKPAAPVNASGTQQTAPRTTSPIGPEAPQNPNNPNSQIDAP